MTYSQKVYDQLADTYPEVSQERSTYLSAVDNIIIPQITKKNSLLDLGSGDGVRATHIAKQAQILHVTLVENSHEMVKKCKQLDGARVIEESIEKIQPTNRYDVITCLWNVLGNVDSYNDRIKVLNNIKSFLKEDGVFFFDVLNRYNISYYGLQNVAIAFIKDLFRDGKNSNKIYTKYAGSREVIYNVHYFTHNEILKMLEESGLRLIKVYFVDYITGKQKNKIWQGQLVYKVRL